MLRRTRHFQQTTLDYSAPLPFIRVAGDPNIPQTFGRFTYADRCNNGYCLGVQSIPLNINGKCKL